MGAYRLLRITDIQNNNVEWDNVPYTDFEKDKANQYLLDNGDIVFARTGATVGKSYLVRGVPSNAIYASYLIRIKTSKEVYPEYLKLFFESGYYWQQITEGAVGIGQPNVNGSSLGNLLLPIPPKSEQLRIVKKSHEIISLVGSLDDNIYGLQGAISVIKSKILDLAMQGKLVKQDSSDEPAADMLRRINPKAKIITDNPHLRNIPQNWCICELHVICEFLSRGKSPKYSESPNQYPVFAQKCNLKEGGISLLQARFLDETTISKWPERYKLKTGDVLINSTGTGTVGRTRLFNEEYLGTFPFVVPDSHVSVVRTYNDINSDYIFYYLYSDEIQTYFDDNLAGSTNQKELYIDVIGKTQILLPPYKEQCRIVAVIENLYSTLDEIEASLQS